MTEIAEPVSSAEDTASAQNVAERAAAHIVASDTAFRHFGMELITVSPGAATLAMTIADDMTNGHDTAHGGMIFTLADTAFAFACNAYGLKTVAAQCSITFVRPGRRGDRLVARAREVSRAGRNGIYDVTVSVGDTVIAEFRGHSRTIGGSFVEDASKNGAPVGAPQS